MEVAMLKLPLGKQENSDGEVLVPHAERIVSRARAMSSTRSTSPP